MQNISQKLLEHRQQHGVLIAAHRGTHGGNIVQNTAGAYDTALLHGADMIEMDVIMSTDKEFYSFHNGHELQLLGVDCDIRQMTSAEIDACTYLNVLGLSSAQHPQRLCTLLERYRGRCFINLDRGWFYWEELLKLLAEMGMEKQILLKSAVEPLLMAQLESYNDKVMFMPIIRSMADWELLKSYSVQPVAVELVFDSPNSPLVEPIFINELHAQGLLLWVNAITLGGTHVLSGGLDDNGAITEGFDKHWGKLLAMGFDIVQTDWPALLQKFMKQ